MRNNLDPGIIGERILQIKQQRGCSIIEAADDLFRDLELGDGGAPKPAASLHQTAAPASEYRGGSRTAAKRNGVGGPRS
jgi:hypothetical protein